MNVASKLPETSRTESPRQAAKPPFLGFGLGLRHQHYDEILEGHPPVDWFEVISENYMVPGGQPLQTLEKIRARASPLLPEKPEPRISWRQLYHQHALWLAAFRNRCRRRRYHRRRRAGTRTR